MDFNKEIQKIIEGYGERLEELVPDRIPPTSRFLVKREEKSPLLLRAGRLGVAWMAIVALFAWLSLVAVRTMSPKKTADPVPVLNAAVFAADHPGSVVSAFREVTE